MISTLEQFIKSYKEDDLDTSFIALLRKRLHARFKHRLEVQYDILSSYQKDKELIGNTYLVMQEKTCSTIVACYGDIMDISWQDAATELNYKNPLKE
jgi:hypothetical protein